jgi:hypothetical protein
MAKKKGSATTKDLVLSSCMVCKDKPKVRLVESLEGPEEWHLGGKWYVIECRGFAHSVILHHKRKASVVKLWNLIMGEQNHG